MNNVLQQRFFRLLSEYSQHEVFYLFIRKYLHAF